MGPILLLVGTALAVGWFAPDWRLPAASNAKGTAVQQTAPPAPTPQTHSWAAEGTVLDRERDGHFYVDVRIDEQSTRLLIDTGASMVALTGEDARRAGLDWNPSDLVLIGRGANGPVYGVPIRLDRVELGDFEARDIQAAIIPEGLEVSLLGQSFLSRLGSVRIDGDRMVLGG